MPSGWRGPLSFDAAARLIATVARAVEHLHAHGIVHRDLKPSNILLDRDEQPYVTDFGLAKVFVPGSEATVTGVIAGTPSYMAPEQAAGRRAEIGPAADIYSLGAVLYELLTGAPPFRQESPLDTLLDILGREPPYPRQVNPRVPRELELICLKCLAKSPAERYVSAAALADDLERYIRQEPLAVRPPGLLQRAAQWTRRRPALACRLAALGVFYLVELVNYHYGVSSWTFHWKITVLAAVWAAVSLACDWLVGENGDISDLPKRPGGCSAQIRNVPVFSLPARLIWGTFDSLFLLAALLFVAGGVTSGLIAVYPLLIAASALWFHARFVGFMTVLSLVSYGILVIDFYFWRTDLQQQFDTSPTRHVIFALSLVVLGAIVAWLVRRLRTLSQFCGRQLP